MARFRGIVQGIRGPASRLGNKTSGITVQANGWHSGVTVVGNDNDGADVFTIIATGGTNGSTPFRCLGEVQLMNGVLTFYPTEKE